MGLGEFYLGCQKLFFQKSHLAENVECLVLRMAETAFRYLHQKVNQITLGANRVIFGRGVSDA